MLKPVKSLLKKAYYSKRFNRTAVRLYSMLRPLPYQRPNMEFDFDVWNGICTFHAYDGRQIGENNTNPEVYKEIVETESRICRFEGKRYGLPINMTALKQVMAVWTDALQFVTLLRNDYIRRRGISGERLNLRQGYLFSKVGAAYTAYLARKRDHPLTSLPPLETAFFTLGVGPFMLVRSYMELGDLTVLTPDYFSGVELYQMADDARTLISPMSGFGCAGSKELITEFVDVTMNGSYRGELTSPEARRALDAIGDWDEFYRYVYASSRLELLVKLAQALCAQALMALGAAPHELQEGEREPVERCVAATYQRPEDATLDDRAINANFMTIVLALLDEFDAPQARRALSTARLLDAEGSVPHQPADPGGGALRQGAARRIRLACEVLYPLCAQELADVHRALRRFEDQSITVEDLYRRCGGAGLFALVQTLSARAPRG